MRRALLTAAKAAPITVGNPESFAGAAFVGQRMAVERSGPADGTGTIATVKVQMNSAVSDLRVLTGSLVGSTYTVRDVSGALSVAAGLNTVTVSLAVQAGDLIGYWSATGTAVMSVSSIANSLGTASPAAAPTVGQNITLTTTNDKRACVFGTS